MSLRLPSVVHASALALLATGLACSGSSNNGGASSSSGGVPPGSDGGPGTNPDGGGTVVDGPALPAGTFLYTRSVANDKDHLIARDLATGAERVVTDLKGDGSEGWSINGFSLSSDRKRIVLASLYGPTTADTSTLLATQRIWMLDTEGKSFARLTPVFKNSNPGTPGFRIDVRNPVFSRDGSTVYYQYGEQVIGSSAGITRAWAVSTDGSAVPDLLETSAACSIASVVSVDPSSGKVMIEQDLCQQTADQAFVFFTADKQPPETVYSFGSTLNVNPSPPRWAVDGSFFLFTTTDGLYALDMARKQPLKITSPAGGARVENGAVAPDGSAIVYCVRDGASSNLHVIDLTKSPAEDRPLTTDGRSCNPVF